MKGIYIHLDVETMGPIPKDHALFQIAMLAHWEDTIPDFRYPFTKRDPCFIDEVDLAIKIDKDKIHPRTLDFWNKHQSIQTTILQNASEPHQVAERLCDFFNRMSSLGEIKGIVMSPTWFDWSHFVHFYNSFATSLENSFDLAKVNVICLKTMSKMAKLCGIPWFYHPLLKHTHNAKDDVREAAWRFIWLLRSFHSIGSLFPNMPIVIENRLRQGPIETRWRRPPKHHSNSKMSETVVKNFLKRLEKS